MNLQKKLESYLRVNLLGPGPRLMKKENLPGRGLTRVEKHWCTAQCLRCVQPAWTLQKWHFASAEFVRVCVCLCLFVERFSEKAAIISLYTDS